jgi:competence protein ComEA
MEHLRQSTIWRRTLPLGLLLMAALLAFRLLLAPAPAPEAQAPGPLLLAPATAAPPEPTSAPTPPSPAPALLVYVSGAVVQPGVYALAPDARSVDALRAAGGPLEDADLIQINLAARLHDEQQIYFPRLGETPPPLAATAAPDDSPPAGPQGTLNINAASAEQLEALPRIGPAVAQRIVEYRDENGPFASPEDLLEVPGIGPSIVEAIAAQIDFGPPE